MSSNTIDHTLKTAVGKSIKLIDSADSKIVGLKLYGKSEQPSYTGKNLLNLSNVRYSDVYYELWGYALYSSTSNWSRRLYYLSCTANTNYTISGISGFENVEIAFTTQDISSLEPDESTTFEVSTISAPTIYTDNSDVITVTAESNSIYMLISIYDTDNPTADIDLSKVQIEEGNTATEYEPFVGGIPSPNPDYPQEITVSGLDGSVEVKSVGKNLLKNTATSQTFNGVTFTVNKDGSITAKGTATAQSHLYFTYKCYVQAGQSYVYSGCVGGSTSTYWMSCEAKDSSGASVGNIGATCTDGGVTFIAPDTMAFFNAAIYIKSGETVNTTFYPMLRLASDTDDTFESYTETISTIPTPDGLCGIKVSSGGNYTDENGQQWICDEVVKYADGSSKSIQRIGKKVFDGVNNVSSWVGTITGRTEILTQMNLPIRDALYINSRSLLCNKFKTIQWISASETDAYSCRQSDDTVCCYLKESDNVTDVTTANTWLKENNVIIYYILKEPIITDLSAEEIAEIEKLHTFYPITTISNDSECNTEITYRLYTEDIEVIEINDKLYQLVDRKARESTNGLKFSVTEDGIVEVTYGEEE